MCQMNQCVCCGNYDNLTKHHIVPHCYRRKMDDSFKNEYQLITLCQYCHNKYESQANIIKCKLQVEYFNTVLPDISHKKIHKASGHAANLLHNNINSINNRIKSLNYISNVMNINVMKLNDKMLECIYRLSYDYSIILEIKHPQEIIDIFVEDFRKFLIYNASIEMRFSNV